MKCKLLGIENILSTGDIGENIDPHQGMNCSVVGKSLFDLMSQPCMDSKLITPELFDAIPFTEPFAPPPQQNSGKIVQKRTATAHVKSVDIGCDLCSEQFSTPTQLKNHVETFHHNTLRKFCPIPLCVKTFTKSQGLSLHLKGNCHVDANRHPITVQKPVEKLSNPLLQTETTPEKDETSFENVKKSSAERKKGKQIEPKNREKKDIKPKEENQCKQSEMKVTSKKDKKSKETEASAGCHDYNADTENDSDAEFLAKPLPIPGEEMHGFYEALVKTVVAADGKVTFICRKCRTTCTRRADVKRHWKSLCAHNPSPEIQC